MSKCAGGARSHSGGRASVRAADHSVTRSGSDRASPSPLASPFPLKIASNRPGGRLRFLASSGDEGIGTAMFEWFYTRNKEQFGPVNSTQLKELAARGKLLPSDLACKDGMSEWVSAATLKSIFGGAGGGGGASGAPVPVALGGVAPGAPGGGG